MNSRLLIGSLLSRLARHRARTVFMGLGIAVGVAATAMLMTVAIGFERQLRRFVERAYPADGVVVFAGSGPMGGGGGPANLRIADLETLASSLSIPTWDPMVNAGQRDLQRQGIPLRAPLIGVSDRAQTVRRRSVDAGEFLRDDDLRTRALVAVIGATTAATLFPEGGAVGGELTIDNLRFVVRGVLEKQGADPHGGDLDNAVWIPYTTMMDRITRSPRVSAATFQVAEADRTDQVGREITEILRREHAIVEGQRDDFTVITPRQMRAMVDRSMRAFGRLLPLILGTVFLISALVIGGLQQASVRARTAEIGLRKAVGARHRDVAAEILLEVAVIAAVAAAVGATIALVGLQLLETRLTQHYGIREVWPPLMVWLGALAGALGAATVGALLPARRAVRLRPVEALRQR